jgi:hypothetical protein
MSMLYRCMAPHLQMEANDGQEFAIYLHTIAKQNVGGSMLSDRQFESQDHHNDLPETCDKHDGSFNYVGGCRMVCDRTAIKASTAKKGPTGADAPPNLAVCPYLTPRI